MITPNGRNMTGSKGRILLITRHAPPIGGSHGNRVRNFLKYLAESGWDVDVLTTSASPWFPHYDPSLIDWHQKGVRIFRTSAGPLTAIYWFLMKVLSLQPKFAPVAGPSKISTNPLLTALKVLSYSGQALASIPLTVASTLAIASTPIEWFPFAVYRGLRLAGKHNYNIMISSTCHLIAYAIKKRTGLRWVTDYADPVAFDPPLSRNKMKFQVEYTGERRILKLADALVVTTQETKQDFLKHYPFLNEAKVVVIPMGVDYGIFKKATIKSADKFRILYVGEVYPGTRTVEPFMDAIRLFEKQKHKEVIEVNFAGRVTDEITRPIRRKQLWDTIKPLGFTPYDEIPGLLMGSDVLLFLGNQGGLQVPGKLFEYLAARRPILFIKGDEKDPSLQFLEHLNRGIIVNNRPEEIYGALVQFCDLYKTGTLDTAFNLAPVPGISWKERAEILSRLCMKLVASKNGH